MKEIVDTPRLFQAHHVFGNEAAFLHPNGQRPFPILENQCLVPPLPFSNEHEPDTFPFQMKKSANVYHWPVLIHTVGRTVWPTYRLE